MVNTGLNSVKLLSVCHWRTKFCEGSAVVPKKMLVPPSQMLVVRSYCTPASTDQSASKTTAAHGPGQFAGGV